MPQCACPPRLRLDEGEPSSSAGFRLREEVCLVRLPVSRAVKVDEEDSERERAAWSGRFEELELCGGRG